MTSQQPSYLSQSVSYLGFLSQQLGDLTGKTVLAHELIQNADDAKDEAGNLAATLITFDITDEALIVSNDAVFQEVDFERMRNVASGSKREEFGQSTTGMFGVGFISVYQITDRPEILSAGRKWVLRPECPEDQRIEQWEDSTTAGTVFRLPWAFEESEVRTALKAPPIDMQYQDLLVDELSEALPRAILFLKKLERIELCQDGKPVSIVTKRTYDNTLSIEHNGSVTKWNILKVDFAEKAKILRTQHGSIIDQGRSDHVRIAVPDTLIGDGQLFASLPTEQRTELPFHIDADFFPASDRKAILFGDTYDPRSKWNQAAIQAAAAAVHLNLISLRDMHHDDSVTFWGFIDQVASVCEDRRGDVRLPISTFWDLLLPSLRKNPVVFTESGKWLIPSSTRILTDPRDGKTVSAFQKLGIEMVHRNLWSYWNRLRHIGVSTLSISDVHHQLEVNGHADGPTDSPPVGTDQLDQLWQGIQDVLDNTRGHSAKETAKNLLGSCSLAPGLDGRFWPCRSAYRADDERTRQLFARFMPSTKTFLSRTDISLLNQICPKFEVSDAIKILASQDTEQLGENGPKDDVYDPVSMLHWFEEHKRALVNGLRKQLTDLPIFPSSQDLRPLRDLWLPGGFDDPMNVAEILDIKRLSGLSDFLKSLGVKELTFQEYTKRYVPKAFARGSTVKVTTRQKILIGLARQIGEIQDDDQIRSELVNAWIVECEDGMFRQPEVTYFRTSEVQQVLGDNVHYARIPNKMQNIQALYSWLGVQSQPRVTHLLRHVKYIISNKPSPEAKNTVVKIMEVLGQRWQKLNDAEKSSCRNLQSDAWLPAEKDDSAWHTPNSLYAVYHKYLFASQANFLDVPRRLQQSISEFLSWLNVNVSPKPSLVVKHLLFCLKHNANPPGNIYHWLNQNATPSDLHELQNEACLWVEGKYRRPDQVYWGSHNFGTYRVQLDSNLGSFRTLLEGLGVREKPDHRDAIEVLKDISEDVGSKTLEEEVKVVIHQCWVMLSDAIENDELEAASLTNALRNVECISAENGLLQLPSRMCFEDRSGLRDKFADELRHNCIPRIERAWIAMNAAGVRPVSEVVQGIVVESVHSHHSDLVSGRVSNRVHLIRTILEPKVGTVQKNDNISTTLDRMQFIQADKLMVGWKLRLFPREISMPAIPVVAHWDRKSQICYFTERDDGTYPWSAIARELAFALAPNENPVAISSALENVLEANTTNQAENHLYELGVASLLTIDSDPAKGAVAHSLGDETSDLGSYDQDYLGTSYGDDEVRDGPSTPDYRFAPHLDGVQTPDPPPAPPHPHILPVGGSNTFQSAKDYTDKAYRVDKAEDYVVKLVGKAQRGPKGQALEAEFRSMVHGDYGKRCQICNRTFVKLGGERQVNVVHVVPPKQDTLTNHLGALLGLCGWHFNLLQYGQWALLDPEVPFKDLDGSRGWKRMKEFILNRTPDMDEWGNLFIGLPIRFANVYQEGESDPTDISEMIQYSIPHWTFLCELLKA